MRVSSWSAGGYAVSVPSDSKEQGEKANSLASFYMGTDPVHHQDPMIFHSILCTEHCHGGVKMSASESENVAGIEVLEVNFNNVRKNGTLVQQF